MLLASTFIAVGPEHPPTVHVLPPAERAALDARLLLAARRNSEPARLEAYRLTFGAGARWIFAPEPVTLEWLAVEYAGPFRDAVRGLAACLATGTPYGPDDTGPAGDGGAGDRLPPGPKPGPAPDRLPVADPLAFR